MAWKLFDSAVKQDIYKQHLPDELYKRLWSLGMFDGEAHDFIDDDERKISIKVTLNRRELGKTIDSVDVVAQTSNGMNLIAFSNGYFCGEENINTEGFKYSHHTPGNLFDKWKTQRVVKDIEKTLGELHLVASRQVVHFQRLH